MEVQARQRSICVISETNMKEEATDSTLVTNGCVDYKGRIASKQTTGGWKASPFIIVNEVAERLAFFAVAVNMVGYLVREMHQPFPDAATHVTDWIGAAYVLTLFGAFLADAYLGRFRTIIIFSVIYALGMVLLTLSATIDTMRPPRCIRLPCIPSTTNQKAFLYCALALIALGTGGIKPCVSSFGADQFDESDPSEAQKKYAFFNWFFFAINMGALLGITLMVYIQDEFDWAWGFGVPTAAMITSVVILAAGFMRYRHQKPMGSAFTRFIQVLVVAVRNHVRGVEAVTDANDLYEVFGQSRDHNRSRFRRNKPLEHLHSNLSRRIQILRPNPPHLGFHDRPSDLLRSTLHLLHHPGGHHRPKTRLYLDPGELEPRLCGPQRPPRRPSLRAPRGPLPPLQDRPPQGPDGGRPLRLDPGNGLGRAGRGEEEGHGPKPEDQHLLAFPPVFLIGLAEVFTYVGQLEFFYDEATDGMRSISSALFLSEIGSWLSTAIVKVIEGTTGGAEEGWLRNDLNKSRLEYFYWILAGISAVNFCVYVWVARRYKGRGVGRGSVRDESAETRSGGGGKDEFRSVVI
ncbi:hypothetical protein SASPL_134727 [Salvia splendens]|uniref:Solute carrier family 15 (Peptide/histidine transporter), member 3/4 n=1 Tax=Salvia splendens TaxID=180675 RepID=A0A8X8WWV9_SALSN|nr:hypothetical protein SASPL_134727 [Salvia splendens]